MTTGKKILFSIAMIVLTVLVCVIVLEFVVARFYYSDVYLVSDTIYDPVVGWRLRPGTYWAKAPNRFGKHRIDINEYGIRNDTIDREGEGSRWRLMILGDSFTYGKAVREEHLFSSRMERILHEEGAARRTEIVNAGIPGYGNAQELLLMRLLAAEGVTADCYLLVMFPNDILDNLRLIYSNLAENPLQPGFAIAEDSSLVLVHEPERRFAEESENFIEASRSLDRMKIDKVLRLRIESFLQTKPRLIRAAARIGIQVKFPAMPGLLNAWYRDDVVDRGAPLMRRILSEMHEEAHKAGAPLLIGLVPSQIQVYPETYAALLQKTFPDCELVERWLQDPQKPQREIRSICEDLCIAFVDLLPDLTAHEGGALYIPREGHLSDEGHAAVARSLARFVKESAGRGAWSGNAGVRR